MLLTYNSFNGTERDQGIFLVEIDILNMGTVLIIGISRDHLNWSDFRSRQNAVFCHMSGKAFSGIFFLYMVVHH